MNPRHLAISLPVVQAAFLLVNLDDAENQNAQHYQDGDRHKEAEEGCEGVEVPVLIEACVPPGQYSHACSLLVGKQAECCQGRRVNPDKRDDATSSMRRHVRLVPKRSRHLVVAVHANHRQRRNGRRFAKDVHPNPEATKLDGQRAVLLQVLVQAYGDAEHGDEEIRGCEACNEILARVVKPFVQVRCDQNHEVPKESGEDGKR